MYNTMNSGLFKLGKRSQSYTEHLFKTLSTLYGTWQSFMVDPKKGKGRENSQCGSQKEPAPWLTISLEGSSVGGVGGYPRAALPQRCCNPRRCGADLLVPIYLSYTFITMPEVLPLQFSPGVLKANHVYGSALKIAEHQVL